jgi:hypothetical protein
VIWKFVYFGCALWFTWWDVRQLYFAKSRDYVIALRQLTDSKEVPITRAEDPRKFWANVIVALLLLPVALGGLYLTSTDLYAALTARK